VNKVMKATASNSLETRIRDRLTRISTLVSLK